MTFSPFDDGETFFRAAWDSVHIVRPVRYALFTFGASDLDYYLVLQPEHAGDLVEVSRGSVKVTRATIITPNNAGPELAGFFEDHDQEDLVRFLLARTAQFRDIKLTNTAEESEFVSDDIEEVVAKLNQRLDSEEEDRIAVLVAPAALRGFALLKYTAERITESAPHNLQELQERGFLPDF